MTRDEEVCYLARKLHYIREAGPNSGLRVNGIQRWCGGGDGEPWCLYFATLVLDIAYEGKCAVKRMGSCEALHKIAVQKGWITANPVPGDLALRVSGNWAHHVYIVTDTSDSAIIGTISGNTSEDGLSSEGTGVFEHDIKRDGASLVFVSYPREQVV